MARTRPFLKWAGNKYHCLNALLSVFPKANRLIEPFTGSASIFLNTEYDSYLLGETNYDVINVYSQLKNTGEVFIHFCQQYFTKANNTEAVYYTFRERFNQSQDLKERAALFLYLNKHGYNGLCRYNSSGIYNVPFGRYLTPYFPSKEMLYFLQKCTKATFLCSDFQKTFKEAMPGDLIYCDPPYVPLSKTASFVGYTKNKFTEEDQIILTELASTSAAQGIPVIISNHDTPFTRKLYKQAKIKSFPVARNISCKGHNRVPVKELVAVFR